MPTMNKDQPKLDQATLAALEAEETRVYDNLAVEGGTNRFLDPDGNLGYQAAHPAQRQKMAIKLLKDIKTRQDSLKALESPFKTSRELPEKRVKALHNIGVQCPLDLLLHLPRAHEDRSVDTPFREIEPGERQTFHGYVSRILNVGQKPSRQVMTLHDALPQEGQPPPRAIRVVWFNQPHLPTMLPPGREIRVSGRVSQSPGHAPELGSPEYDLDDTTVNTGRVVPIYPLTRGIRQEWLRQTMLDTLERFAPIMTNPKPDAPEPMAATIRNAHFPATVAEATSARREMASAEILTLQTTLLQKRNIHQYTGASRPINIDPTVANQWLTTLPFQPTSAQLRCIEEIRNDMTKANSPTMQRLLQGEVGSGKTLVALAAAIDCATGAAQTAIMAPTETLAQQHFETVCELLGAVDTPLAEANCRRAVMPGMKRPLHVGLLTGSATAKERRTILGQVKTGIVQILIGTHALIQKKAHMPDLALAIVDEQHRFGVNQRGELRSDAHYLMLTATPIPRTTQLTLYRDLDVSVIDEIPKGRQPVRTILLSESERNRMLQEIRDRTSRDERTFIIYPYVSPSEEQDGLACTKEYPVWCDLLPGIDVGIAHGRMKPRDRARVIADFRSGKIQALCATAIVEVGVDIPQASLMIIESAERFGLAQLHQFRGRIGRGGQPALCCLTITPDVEKDDRLADTARRRLSAMLSTNDGMMLAQEDLRSRGHGEVWGTKQHGADDILQVSPGYYDLAMLEAQQNAADTIFEHDPDLVKNEHQNLATAVERMHRRMDSISTESVE